MNINDTFTVTLSEDGARIWNARYDDLPKFLKIKSQDVAPGHILKSQLWDLMQVFGPHVGLGVPSPFEQCEITPVAAPLAPSDTQGAELERLPRLPEYGIPGELGYTTKQMQEYALAALAQQAPDAVRDAVDGLTDEQILRELRRECDNAFKVLRAHEHEMLANRLNSCVIDVERRLAPKLAEAGKGE